MTTKFIQQSIGNLISEITGNVLKVNHDTKLCAWLEIMGHIGCISVYITKDKNTLDVRIYENICVRYYKENSTTTELSTQLFNLIQINKDLISILKGCK